MSPALFPLGDAAITIDYGNIIDDGINDRVLARFHDLQRHPLPGMIEAIPAYSSLTIIYDLYELREKAGKATVYDWMEEQVSNWLKQEITIVTDDFRRIRIPVSYDGPDLQAVSSMTGLTKEEIIKLHMSVCYRVYMLGFLPGFAYMGTIPTELQLPRKKQPGNIKAGAVAIAGKQTGIYPLDSPGGWWVIGHTDLKLFDAGSSEPCLLRPSDRIEFYSATQSAL